MAFRWNNPFLELIATVEERFHRQLKEALRARNCGAAWAEHIPWALLGLRAAPKDDSAVSSAESVYGTPLALPGQANVPELLTVNLPHVSPPTIIPARQRPHAEAVPPSSLLQAATHVYVRRGAIGGPFKQSYDGPFLVISRTDKVFKIQMGQKVETVSADRLKPHLGASPEVVEPPRRGRPPGTCG